MLETDRWGDRTAVNVPVYHPGAYAKAHGIRCDDFVLLSIITIYYFIYYLVVPFPIKNATVGAPRKSAQINLIIVAKIFKIGRK